MLKLKAGKPTGLGFRISGLLTPRVVTGTTSSKPHVSSRCGRAPVHPPPQASSPHPTPGNTEISSLTPCGVVGGLGFSYPPPHPAVLIPAVWVFWFQSRFIKSLCWLQNGFNLSPHPPVVLWPVVWVLSFTLGLRRVY